MGIMLLADNLPGLFLLDSCGIITKSLQNPQSPLLGIRKTGGLVNFSAKLYRFSPVHLDFIDGESIESTFLKYCKNLLRFVLVKTNEHSTYSCC